MTDNQYIREKNKSISIVGMGWLGFPLGKFMAENSWVIKGATTTAAKVKAINEAGMRGYRLALPSLDNNGEFFSCDILIIALPPSIPEYYEVINILISQITGYKIPWVIFISSTSVYPNTGAPVKEEDAESIASPHSGVRLLEVEDLFRNNRNFETTIIRFAGLYGPGREPGRFLAGKNNVKGPDIPINLIHLHDCIGIISNIIEKGIKGYTFNACAPEHPPRKDFYTKACSSLGLEPPHFNNEPAPFKIIDSGKLIKKLSYDFIHPDPMQDL